jgi:hypothetical protein
VLTTGAFGCASTVTVICFDASVLLSAPFLTVIWIVEPVLGVIPPLNPTVSGIEAPGMRFPPAGLTVQLVMFPLHVVTLINTVTCSVLLVLVTVRLVLPVLFVYVDAVLFPVIVTVG